MKVLLISANTERINMPTLPIGMAAVAASAEAAGHDVRLVDLISAANPDAAVREAVATDPPDAVGISVRNIDDQEMAAPRFLLEGVRDLVVMLRSATAAPIVLGGAGYSIFPDAALAYLSADLGVCGEGETAFLRLLDVLAGGGDPLSVPGVHAAGRGIGTNRVNERDLDRFPDADHLLAALADPGDDEMWVPIQSRRGCPYNCIYCSTPQLEGRRMRFRSPRRIAAELARLAGAGFRKFHFVDNVFNIPPNFSLELCREIAALGLDISWRGIVYPRLVSEELAAAMAESGCREVSLGFESGCDRILGVLDKRFRTGDIRQASDRLGAHGIRRMGFLMLGAPGETADSVRESVDFVRSLDLEMMQVTEGIRIYPRTPLAAVAVEEGIVSPEDDLLRPRFYMASGLREKLDELLRPIR